MSARAAEPAATLQTTIIAVNILILALPFRLVPV
jgi:hypothetical protein